MKDNTLTLSPRKSIAPLSPTLRSPVAKRFRKVFSKRSSAEELDLDFCCSGLDHFDPMDEGDRLPVYKDLPVSRVRALQSRSDDD